MWARQEVGKYHKGEPSARTGKSFGEGVSAVRFEKLNAV